MNIILIFNKIKHMKYKKVLIGASILAWIVWTGLAILNKKPELKEKIKDKYKENEPKLKKWINKILNILKK